MHGHKEILVASKAHTEEQCISLSAVDEGKPTIVGALLELIL